MENDEIKIIDVEIKEKVKRKERNSRVITKENKWKYDNINNEEELKILNELNEDVRNENTEILRSEIKKKLSGYKNQDMLKKKFNKDKFINVEEVVKKLLECKNVCLYCKENAKMFYRYVRDIQQWSLDRIDNNYGHNRDNVEIACLKCNLRRKTIAPDKYILTQEITKIKKI